MPLFFATAADRTIMYFTHKLNCSTIERDIHVVVVVAGVVVPVGRNYVSTDCGRQCTALTTQHFTLSLRIKKNRPTKTTPSWLRTDADVVVGYYAL